MPPHDAVEPGVKQHREREAIEGLAAALGGGDAGLELAELWEEFEAGVTPEARLVRELYAIEMAWQARTYARSGALSEQAADAFVESAHRRVTSEVGRALLEAATV